MLACALSLAGCGDVQSADRRAADSLNVVILVLDTLRPDHLGCYGYDRPTSPNIDRLAAESVVFERASSVAPWTAPALISMVTSLYPTVHGVNSHPHPARMLESIPTLTEILADEGYATAAFTGGGYARGSYGLDQGFQSFVHQLQHTGRRADGEPDPLTATVELSIEWLRAHATKPFFLLFHTYEPHAPYYPEEEHLLAIRPEYDPQAEHERLSAAVAAWNAGEELSDEQGLTLVKHGYHCGFEDVEPLREQSKLLEELERRGLTSADAFHPEIGSFVNDLYDAEIRYADEQIQRLLDALDELELDERTIVVVVSDHGEALGDHGELGHGLNLHGSVLSIAMILKSPRGLASSGRVPQPTSLIDLAPSLLELLGIPSQGFGFQGRSLVPAMRGEGLTRPVFSNSRAIPSSEARQQSVRTARWRYIREDKTSERELYDLDADPGELVNVIELHPNAARALERLLLAQIERDRALAAGFSGERREVEMEADLRAELESLGYLEGDE